MYGVVIALIPALLVSFFYFGIGSAIYRPGDDAQAVAQKARALLAALPEGRAGSGEDASDG